MRQNINLYNALPKKPKFDLTARLLAQIAGGLLGFLFFIYILQFLYSLMQALNLNKLNAAQIAAVTEFAKTTLLYPHGSKNDELTAQIQTLNSKIETKQSLLNTLAQVGLSSSFSNNFISFAKDIIPGVWLTHIHIGKNGQQITLNGTASEPKLIVQFFQQINQDSLFANREFKIFKITNSKSQPGYVDFTIGTSLEETVAQSP